MRNIATLVCATMLMASSPLSAQPKPFDPGSVVRKMQLVASGGDYSKTMKAFDAAYLACTKDSTAMRGEAAFVACLNSRLKSSKITVQVSGGSK